jgi:hypothetical protein
MGGVRAAWPWANRLIDLWRGGALVAWGAPWGDDVAGFALEAPSPAPRFLTTLPTFGNWAVTRFASAVGACEIERALHLRLLPLAHRVARRARRPPLLEARLLLLNGERRALLRRRDAELGERDLP